MEETIARIEQRNPSLNALIYLGFKDARRDAKKAEDAVMKGEALGPFHGVPSAIKDLFDFKSGWPTTFGGVRALKKTTSRSIIAPLPSAWKGPEQYLWARPTHR